ncbi:N-acetylmuramoyl-L-alanine amidase [Paenibacillus gansuensis]|uniref:N-acetylmuramoyl-L-alanine amidase n=1 Tax=Paenibacillus gansuensis TaxID=306542 RepID=A0ABW5PE15_9BACL
MKKWMKCLHLGLAAVLSGLLLPSVPDLEAASAYKATVYADTLNVRSEPSSEARIVGSLKSGTEVTVSKEQYGWLYIRRGTLEGWTAGYYLQKTGGSATKNTDSVKTAAVQSTAMIDANGLRIRKGPGKGNEVLGSLNRGDNVTVLDRSGDWLRIETEDGTAGWVASQYVQAAGSGGNIQTASSSEASSSGSPRSRNGSIRGKVIVVDAGHGGTDPGMIGTTYGTVEKDLNLDTAKYVKDELTAMGAKVIMTRTKDSEKPGLQARVQVSTEMQADAFVSIHYNSSPKQASGILTFYYTETDDLKLARAVEQRLGEGIGLKSNGVSFGDYHILRENPTPATLVELGFLSNPKDEDAVRTSSYQRKAAKAIAKGLRDYFES